MKDNDKETVTLQQLYDKIAHPYCNTYRCCGECDTATNIDENIEENKDKEGLA